MKNKSLLCFAFVSMLTFFFSCISSYEEMEEVTEAEKGLTQKQLVYHYEVTFDNGSITSFIPVLDTTSEPIFYYQVKKDTSIMITKNLRIIIEDDHRILFELIFTNKESDSSLVLCSWSKNEDSLMKSFIQGVKDREIEFSYQNGEIIKMSNRGVEIPITKSF
jgi:hypothetical protein